MKDGIKMIEKNTTRIHSTGRAAITNSGRDSRLLTNVVDPYLLVNVPPNNSLVDAGLKDIVEPNEFVNEYEVEGLNNACKSNVKYFEAFVLPLSYNK